VLRICHFVVSISVSCLLSACFLLPGSGPTKSALLRAEGQHRNVAVVEIDSQTIGLLFAQQQSSVFGTFGDYRPPSDPEISVGDMLQVTLWESAGGGLFSNASVEPSSAGSHSIVTPEQSVDRDGSITVPFAGRVPVVGRTPSEVEWDIRRRLSETAINPQAVVTVKRLSNAVTVISEGGRAARVPLSEAGERLLEAIAQAGGIRTAASDISVILSRGDRVVRVPLEAVLRDPREDIYLQAGDVVTQVLDPQSFTAVGATGRNNVVKFGTADLTLDEALGKAGGLLDDRADPAGVFVIRVETGAVAQELARTHGLNANSDGLPTIYHLDLRDPTGFVLAKRFSMRNKDVLYVANSPFDDFEKVAGIVSQLTTPAFTALLLQQSVL
jgi:polysaccharide export outer membrane protein